MIRGNDLFYSPDAVPDYLLCQTSAQQFIQDPKLYTLPVAEKPKDNKAAEAEKKKAIVMKVSICCTSCVELIEHDIKKLNGIKSVDCDIYRHKVTVDGAANVVDVLSAARRRFRDAKLWE